MFFRKVDSFIEKWIADYKIREENNINKCLLIKGMFFENIMSQLLFIICDNVYYFSRKSTLEIDFLIENKQWPIFIEAKSSNNTKAKSLSTVMKEFENSYGIKVSGKNIGINDRLYAIPHYGLNFYNKIISD